METGSLNSLAKKTHMNMLTGWPFLLCIGSIVPSATNSKWHTLCYKVGLANNGPLDDMILVWSKCDFFFSIGSHDGDDRGATASLKIFVDGLLNFIQSRRMMRGK